MTQGYYAIIKSDVLGADNLNATDKLVMACIASFAQRNGCCWAYNERIATALCMATKTVTRAIKRLELVGLINVEYDENATNKDKRKIFLVQKCPDCTPEVVHTAELKCPGGMDTFVPPHIENITTDKYNDSKTEQTGALTSPPGGLMSTKRNEFLENIKTKFEYVQSFYKQDNPWHEPIMQIMGWLADFWAVAYDRGLKFGGRIYGTKDFAEIMYYLDDNNFLKIAEVVGGSARGLPYFEKVKDPPRYVMGMAIKMANEKKKRSDENEV